MTIEDEPAGGTAPCFGHLLVDGHLVDPDTVRDVARFRRAERARLVAARALSTDERAKATASLIQGLNRIVDLTNDMSMAVYWPIRGEPDLRVFMRMAHDAGVQVLLPVVIEKQAPLEFHRWFPESRMTRGFWNILVPAEGKAQVPDIIIAPLVGVDKHLFRLGNGGGYYDRTLARFKQQPRSVGVGFGGCLIPTIFPMPWDVQMTEVLLSDGTHLTQQCLRSG